MLTALSKTVWLRLNAIWEKRANETSTTYMETRPVQQQTMKSHEAYSQVRRNMY
mgnify:CR=1 FL=1